MKVLPLFCLIVFIIYGGFGAFIMGAIVHESYHKWDMRDVPKWSDDICLLRWPSLDADYSINTNASGAKLFEEKTFTSEIAAYSISFIITFPWAIMVGYLFWRILK
jgi:hypothetical protein